MSDANCMLQWMSNAVSRIMSWESVDISLKRVTLADDMEKSMAALQLMMGQQISGTSGLKSVGLNWKTEQKNLSEEALTQQRMQAEQQEQAEQSGFAQQIAKGQNPAGGDQAAQGGAPAPSGAPAQGTAQQAAAGGMPVSDYIAQMDPNAMVTPNDLQATAEALSQELLGLPEGVKDSQLRELKQANPTLHSLVRSKMDDTRNALKQQGGAQLQAQQFGGVKRPHHSSRKFQLC